LLISLLAGCGGGSGEDEATRTDISTNAMSFTAAAPDAPAPAPQVITATFGSDIAHLAVVHSGDAITSATSVLNGRTAQITVQPPSPSDLGPGAFTGAVAVTGYSCADATCTKLSAGSTSTVAVNYQISPVVQLITPYVVTAGVSDNVVIRGVGLSSFAIQGVRFGTTAATAVALLNGSEIRATYPALPAGTYPIALDSASHQGPIPSTATLVVVDPIPFAAGTLTYPAGTTSTRRLIYDAAGASLLLVGDGNGGSIVRYSNVGGVWSAPVQSGSGLGDASLSADGRQLFGVNATSVVPIDVATLTLGTPIAAPSIPAGAFLKNIVVGSDNRAVITTGINAATATLSYIFTPSAAIVQQSGLTTVINGTPAIAGNGSAGVVIQGDPSLTTAPLVYGYSASSNAFASAGISVNQNTVAPAVDRSMSRIVLNGERVYDSVFNFLGTLPNTTAAVALRSDGGRAYAYDPTAGGIVTYDTSVDRDEAAYAPLGAVVPLAGNPGTAVKMIITPDGGTLFLAGTGGEIVIQPTPAP
jgi:hypothetical protein